MTGIEIAVGCAFGWLARKAHRVADRADGQIDEALDAGVDALGAKAHRVITDRLGSGDKGLVKLQQEAESGLAQPSEATTERLVASLKAESVEEPGFAEELQALIEEIKASGDGSLVVARVEHGVGQLNVSDNAIGVGNVEHDLHLTVHPSQPGRSKG